jgi:cytoplasmic iron level regulating protein YaaA (DUF328/UPF0246 family)
MRRIVLVSCVKSKLSKPAKALFMYTSPLFRYNLHYATTLKPDRIFILSAKYGLLELQQVIEPYEMSLNTMKENEKKAWAVQVLKVLQTKTDFQQDHFIFLAGSNYRKYLLPYLKHVEVPFEGLSFGKQLQALKRRLNE